MSRSAETAWAKMHVEFVLKGIAAERNAAQRAPYYEALMRRYPELESSCKKYLALSDDNAADDYPF